MINRVKDYRYRERLEKSGLTTLQERLSLLGKIREFRSNYFTRKIIVIRKD